MKMLFIILALLLPLSLSAQTVSVYAVPHAVSVPIDTYQTCKAIVNGSGNQAVTWSTTGGTVFAGQDPNTEAVTSATTGTITLTATSVADGTKSATCVVTFTGNPTVATDYPRLLIPASQVATMQAKGITGSNPLYAALFTHAQTAYTADSSIWTYSTWSGSACTGGSGPSSDQSGNFAENDAYWMAQVGLFDNNATTRQTYGCAARTVFLTMIGYVISKEINMETGNRWSDSIEQWAFTADLLMGGGYLSSADQTVVRQYLASFAQQQVVSVNGAQGVVTGYNTPAQFDASSIFSYGDMRAMMNNYTQPRMLAFVAAGLEFDDNTTADPPLTNTCSATRYQVCPDGTAGSLHAYFGGSGNPGYMTGGMLYKYWANEEDPGIVQQVYNAVYADMPTIPYCGADWGGTIPCLGSSQGGEPSEGTNYGNSFTAFVAAATAIQNAGYDNPSLYGPQMSALTSSYNDLRVLADYTVLTGFSGLQAEASRWNYMTDGDSGSNYNYPSNYTTESTLLRDDYLTGRTDRSNELEWIMLNTAFGGADGTHCTSCSLGPYGYMNEIGDVWAEDTLLDAFLALPAANPVTTNPPTDPRSSFPTDWYAAGNQHIEVRDNGWGTGTDTIYSTYCTNTFNDHEHTFCGGFDVYSNGEYITKGRMEYDDYNDAMSTAMYKNTAPALQSPGQTTCTMQPFCQDWESVTFGGELWHGNYAGTVAQLHSDSPAYVANTANDLNFYNGGFGGYGSFNHITGVSQDQIYLRGTQQIVTYNRVASGSNSWDKPNFLVTTGVPTISSGTATWLTRSGTQKAAWTPLLPSGASFSSVKLPQFVTLTADFSSLNSSSTMQAKCTVTYADGTTANISSTAQWAGNLTWSSDNLSAATISSTGLITAVGVGTFTLKCDYLGLYAYTTVAIISGASSTPAINVSNSQTQTNDWEPDGWLEVDAGNLTGAQFLSVLQWGSSSFTPATATALTSSSGQTFDGALVGTKAAWFMRTWPASFTGVTYPASAATTQYVADLTPSTTYTVSGTGTPSTVTTDTAGVATFSAAGTGNISLSPGGVTAPPLGLSGTISISGNVQLP